MNNNRNNNRRRGRGNNRQQGGGQQLNRIDSRARGNAPQLLEKYKKLAHDAHLNGDRVQAEYYLQFADHYFRVIADTRLRQEEQRARRDERPGESQPYYDADDGEFAGDNDMGFDQMYRREERSDVREERRDGNREEGGEKRENGREGRDGNRNGGRDRGREFRQREGGRDDRGPRRERFEPAPQLEAPEAAEPEDAPERGEEFEPAGGNPFTRDNRVARGGLRPRRDREAPRGFEGEPGAEGDAIDPSLLPPAIGESREALAMEAEEVVPPRKRGRPRKAAAEDGEPLETVNG